MGQEPEAGGRVKKGLGLRVQDGFVQVSRRI